MPPVTRSTTRLSTDIYTQVNRPRAPEPTPYFPQFKRFPLEIRLIIWEAAIEPRVVHLQLRRLRECHHILRHVRSDLAIPDLCGPKAPLDVRLYTCSDFLDYDELDDYINDQRIREGREHPLLGFTSDCSIPPVLLACHESFKIASRSYTPSFSSLGSWPQTYFNFKLDTLYVDWATGHSPYVDDVVDVLQSVAASDEFAKIERLAVNDEIPFQYGEYETDLCRVLGLFGNVRDLTIVHMDFTGPAMQAAFGNLGLGPKIFVEPVDVTRRCYMFDYPEYHINHDSENAPAKEEYYKVIGERFDEERDLAISLGKPFVRPVIDHKILMTPKMKAKFDAYQQAYEAVCSCRCYEEETVWLPREE